MTAVAGQMMWLREAVDAVVTAAVPEEADVWKDDSSPESYEKDDVPYGYCRCYCDD